MAESSNELVASEFFGFVPEKLYEEVYAISYNEFLAAVTSLKEVLLQEFPEKREEVERGCSSLLASYGKHFDQQWFTKFLQYCSKNIFTVPRHVPIYEEGLGKEENQGAILRLEELRHCIMATEYLNSQLQARVKEMDAEIKRRISLLQQLKKAERKEELLQRARELEGQLRQMTSSH